MNNWGSSAGKLNDVVIICNDIFAEGDKISNEGNMFQIIVYLN